MDCSLPGFSVHGIFQARTLECVAIYLHTIFHSGCINLHFHQQCRTFLFSTPSPAFIVCKLFDDVHSYQCEVISHCSFDLHFSKCQQIWKTQQWPQDWKRSVFIPIPKKGNAKECSNYHTIALISHASKVMLKILQARIQ